MLVIRSEKRFGFINAETISTKRSKLDLICWKGMKGINDASDISIISATARMLECITFEKYVSSMKHVSGL